MFTRKQQWRRTRTRKHTWGDLPPEVLEAMLAASGGGMSKSVSWDHSYAVGLKLKANKAAEAARREAAQEDSRVRAAAAAQASGDGGAGEAVHIPRSVSCSSLAAKRTLFPRSSSKDELGSGGARARGASAGVRRRVLHRRGVCFDTQVKMVLIPKREEFNETERARLWWGREDYAQFRQVLIDWKRANAHRISHSDNILSIDLGDIDDEYTRDHDEAMAAADAMAAAAAAVAVAAKVAADNAAQTAAVATAAATAAFTAAQISASNAREHECERDGRTNPAILPSAAQEVAAAEAVANEEIEAVYSQRLGDEAPAEAGAAAVGELQPVGGLAGGVGAEYLGADGMLSEITEEEEVVEGAERKRIATHKRASASFSMGGSDAGRATPDFSSTGGANGLTPLRRSFSIGRSPPRSTAARHLKAVALSEKQATTESLRAWRKGLDARNYAGLDLDGGGVEDRGRAVSMQQQHRSYAHKGRATVMIPGRKRNAAERDEDGDASNGVTNGATGAGEEEAEEGKGAREGGERSVSDQRAPPAIGKGAMANHVMAAFERQRHEAIRQQEEEEAAQAASAAAMVEAAAAVAEAASQQAEMKDETPLNQEGHPGVVPGCRHEDVTSGSSEVLAAEGGSVVEVGLNDAPGSAAAAAAAGIRMAADGVSNLSLRSRDSVESLQELAEHAWGQVPLSSSA